MMLIFSSNAALGATYGEILDKFNPSVLAQKDAFLEKLSQAKLVVIDEDKNLLDEALKQNLPQTVLFITNDTDINNDEVSVLNKPLSSSVLLAKVELLWQRVQNGLFISFTTPHYAFDGTTRTLNNIVLTQKETALIEYLFEHKDRIVSKDELLEQIFGYKEGVETHTLETHIYKLRQKTSTGKADLILTCEGGYRLNLE